ncbi:O-antigen ligase family protein [Rhizobium sp. SGZ-381]|uniref:O-antigen ligase family protein n=1 Tax=Rhizobium sp. SGZ-381 TaxID=3342800 RepID=UPI0036717F9A
MPTFKQILLYRRRIDGWLVTAAAATFPLYVSVAVVVACLFGGAGLYVVLSSRSRLRRHLWSWNGLISVYALFSVALIAWRGEFETGNRQLGFMLLLLALSFITPGLCLVQRPLRHIVLGARIGICCAVLLALFAAIQAGSLAERYDGHGNAAIVAFLIALAAAIGTIRLKAPPRFLPNGLMYLLLACFPIFLTQTRAVLIVMPVLCLVEFLMCSLDWRPRLRNRAYVAAAIGIVLMLLLPPVQTMLMERFVNVYEYYVAGAPDPDMKSGDIRLVMWQSAVAVIRQHLLTGVGLMDMFTEMKAVAGPASPMLDGFKHPHNVVLQELLANGVLGLCFMLAILVGHLRAVIASGLDDSTKRGVLYVAFTVAAFGMLHDPFYHELCMSTIMLFSCSTMAQVQRLRLLTPQAQKRKHPA